MCRTCTLFSHYIHTEIKLNNPKPAKTPYVTFQVKVESILNIYGNTYIKAISVPWCDQWSEVSGNPSDLHQCQTGLVLYSPEAVFRCANGWLKKIVAYVFMCACSLSFHLCEYACVSMYMYACVCTRSSITWGCDRRTLNHVTNTPQCLT